MFLPKDRITAVLTAVLIVWFCLFFSTIFLVDIPLTPDEDALTIRGEGRTPKLNRHPVAKSCPEIDVGEASFWSIENSTSAGARTFDWVFHNTHPEGGGKIVIPRGRAMGPKALDEITRNKTSVVFFGSSHIRELYFAFIRLRRGMDFNGMLERNVTRVRNGKERRACDPYRTGYKNGSYGIDLEACGEPGKRMVPELGENVAIGFKTFLHTPVADNLFLAWLDDNSMRNPDVVITDVGVWGARGGRKAGDLNYTLTLEEEVDYNLQWLRASFPSAKLLMIVEGHQYDDGIESFVNPRLRDFSAIDKDVVLFRKDLVMERKNPKMKCDHGCSGPVLVVVAIMILEWLEKAMYGTKRCLPPPSA